MAIKNIADVDEKINVVGDESLLGIDSDKNVVKMQPSNIPELTEAVGDETVIGVSNGKVVRIPVDSIGGGAVEPVILRAKSSDKLLDNNTVYADGSEVNFNDIKAAFINGIPILIGFTVMGKPEINLNSYIYRVIAVGYGKIYVIQPSGVISIKL